MLTDFFAIKLGMTQAWTKDGRRLAVTRLMAGDNIVVSCLGEKKLEVGFGLKNLKNIKKPQRARYQKGDFCFIPAKLRAVSWDGDEILPEVGKTIKVEEVLSVGNVVAVQGTTKGRGFAGAMKRYGFKGGPKTHGQSDRSRAVGSIGSGTTPGRIWKGKRMPGHYGVETQTVSGLLVLHIDPKSHEIWLSGPVPGHIKSFVRIHKTTETKKIELNKEASGISQPSTTTEEKGLVK